MDIILTIIATALVTWFFTRLQMKSADRRRLISDVADKYKKFVDTGQDSGVGAMIRSGVCRLRDHREVLEALQEIRDYGLGDPFGSRRDQLAGKDLHHFFVLVKGDRYSSVHGFDWDAVVNAAKEL